MEGDAPTTDPARPDATAGDAGAALPSRRSGRRWLRRMGLGLVLVLAAVALGFQLQVAEVRDQVDHAEAVQRRAERDERAAASRLTSVGARLSRAAEDEAAAQATLDRSRAGVQAAGLEEERLGEVRVETARRVKELRSAVRSVQAQIEEQGRLQPAAAACLFDLLRALGQVDDANTGPRSEACSSVTSSRGPG
jgi:hypothetical protein